MTVTEFSQPPVTVRFQTKPLAHDTVHLALKEMGIGSYKHLSQSPDGLEHTVQPITMGEILADLTQSSKQITVPEVEHLKVEYKKQDMPLAELVVRYEEAVQEYFALFSLLTERCWDSWEARKMADLIKEKYWGHKRFRPDPGPALNTTPRRPMAQTTLIVDPDDFD